MALIFVSFDDISPPVTREGGVFGFTTIDPSVTGKEVRAPGLKLQLHPFANRPGEGRRILVVPHAEEIYGDLRVGKRPLVDLQVGQVEREDVMSIGYLARPWGR